MALLRGFPAVVDQHARVLILGSMPSVESLRQQEYYAHPQNAFWFIMGELFDAGRDSSYVRRLAILKREKIALWDSVHSCRRKGSRDSAIEEVVPNDFVPLLKTTRNLRAIIFNGRKSEELFTRHVLPGLGEAARALSFVYMPSTSPANASMKRERKLECWREIRTWL